MKTVLMTYSDYIQFLIDHSFDISSASYSFETPDDFKALFKMIHLDVDELIPFLEPFYSNNGRPAKNQIQILRSFILMSHYKYLSISKWAELVNKKSLYALLCGFEPHHAPSPASYYDFINRFYLAKEESHVLPAGYFSNKYTSKDKPNKGEKLENFDKNDTRKIVDSYKDHYVDDLPEDAFHKFLQVLGVGYSVKNGLIDNSRPSVISSDGTAIATHSNCFGHHIKDDDTNRRYSDIDANWGWDSDLNKFYFGYSGFTISIHSSKHHIDLPAFLTVAQASQHDAITCLETLAKYMSLNITVPISHWCLDSASDNYATHEFAYSLNINPVIDINKRGTGKNIYAAYESISENGVPICQNHEEMLSWGCDHTRHRHKFRCPHYKDLSNCSCPFKDTCTSSSYGRVIYIKCSTDIRLFGVVRYQSNEWKEIYKNRTSCERMNTRIINDYKIKDLKMHGKKRYIFMMQMMGINVHLDAYYKTINQ